MKCDYCKQKGSNLIFENYLDVSLCVVCNNKYRENICLRCNQKIKGKQFVDDCFCITCFNYCCENDIMIWEEVKEHKIEEYELAAIEVENIIKKLQVFHVYTLKEDELFKAIELLEVVKEDMRK